MSDESGSSDDEYSERARTTRSKEVNFAAPTSGPRSGGIYEIRLRLFKSIDYGEWAQHVSANMLYRRTPSSKRARTDANGSAADGNDGGEDVGYLDGYLLRRPCRIFFEMADALDGELQGLACLFCSSGGSAERVDHPRLRGDDAVHRGGFLHIPRVEVRSSHSGQDLGLRLVHETLVFLRDLWSLAVAEPAPLSRHCLRWPEEDGQRSSVDRGMVQVARHFGRMGFVQAGRTRSLANAWFLTKDMYFAQDTPDNVSNAISRWVPRDQAKVEIDVYQPPARVEAVGPDRELKEAVEAACSRGVNAGADIEALVRRGASVDNARALHIAAANAKENSLLALLLRLGGNVNGADEDGNRPLHVAAAARNHNAVSFLTRSGADRSLADGDGQTPLQAFEAACRSMDDFQVTFGLTMIKEIDIVPKIETAKALMSSAQESSLVEGWLSPRMRFCLLTTAEIEGDNFRDGGDELFTRPREPVALRRCAGVLGFNRIDYIPLHVLQRDSRGIFRSFHDGFGMCFDAFADILRRNQIPTVQRIQAEIQRGSGWRYDSRKFNFYLDHGGKIEYALDAVLKVTENVVVDGDDGWEYCMFEEEIEALPSNPLDKMFDVARFMCINRGGGILEGRGPYREVTTYDLDQEDDD